MFEYKMVQIPQNIVTNKKNIRSAAADYLERLVNELAQDGWEFLRIDGFSTEESPGCLSFLAKSQIQTYHVVSFRREIKS